MELAWRLIRIHELRRRSDSRERDRLEREVAHLLPHTGRLDAVRDRIAAIETVGLRSIIESLQLGIERTHARFESALSSGLLESDWNARAGRLTFQHRMHHQISEFPRRQFYDDTMLLNANTLDGRDEREGFAFGPLPSRRMWLDVPGREHKGVNRDEIEAARRVLRTFLAWTAHNPRRDHADVSWKVAVLAFYLKQEAALQEMVQEVTGIRHLFRAFDARARHRVEIRTGTVDRFQGREADLVILSLRNTGRTGFLDSPNRLNVALTRARHVLVVVGHREYFRDRCRVSELEELARATEGWQPR